jgi:hypothetical protein
LFNIQLLYICGKFSSVFFAWSVGHSLRGGGGNEEDVHEGTKRAGSTQAKGAATITKAMQAKSSATKGRDRGNSKNAQRLTSKWNFNFKLFYLALL